MIVYEPALEDELFYHSRVERNLATFKQQANVIVANRRTAELDDVAQKVYPAATRSSTSIGCFPHSRRRDDG